MRAFDYISTKLVVLFVGTCTELALASKGGFYAYKVKNIRGKSVSLETYRGKVSLVVNLASECGYTDEHYKELTALYNELAVKKKEPFTVLGFPCNQFGEQEPHDDNEIENFAREMYGARFPLFSKLDVTDRTADPAFRFLAEKSGKSPTWNFWKYLLDSNGNVLDAWGPRVSVETIKPEILRAIDRVKMTHKEL